MHPKRDFIKNREQGVFAISRGSREKGEVWRWG